MSSAPIYVPSKWGAEFHALTVREALGAGSAGPGKTEVLIHEPDAQILAEHERCANPNHPHHQPWGSSSGWALYLRRELPMLVQTIRRACRAYKAMDPGFSYNKQEKTGTFSSGYRVQFGHCANDDDIDQYFSNEYCCAEGTLVKMADGTSKAIETIEVGDEVLTLEGACRVTATYDTGVKPCVEMVVRDQHGIVGKQVHPTTHPVLLWPSDESPLSPSPGSTRSVLREQPHGLVWQDYESLLDGRPESPVRRVSQVDGESDFVGSDGSRRDMRLLPALTVPVALHGRPSPSKGTSGHSPSECRRPPGSLVWWGATRRALRTLGQACTRGPLRAAAAALRGLTGTLVPLAACDGAGAPSYPGTATGSTPRYSPCLDLRGAPPRAVSGGGRACAPPQADAPSHDRSLSRAGDPGRELARSQRREVTSYPHFYTGGVRPVTEVVRRGEADIRFVGWLQTYDLTVERANHYINASTDLVSCQTLILFDELTQFDEAQYDAITSRLRSTDPVLRPMMKIRSMSNPFFKREGNTGVRDPFWVRRLFVEPARQGRVRLVRKVKRPDGKVAEVDRIYLPAKLTDNPDKQFVEDYMTTLSSKPEHIRRALLEGDWFFISGSFFGEDFVPSKHVVKPFDIPTHWPRFRAMDWGYKTAGVVGWWAVDEDDNLYLEREFSFSHMSAREVAKRVREIEKQKGLWHGDHSRISGPADTQLWEQRGDSGMSKAEEFEELGVSWERADKRSRARNAERVLERLNDYTDAHPKPGLMVFETCSMSIKTIPGLMPDSNDPNAPAKGGDDHWADMWMYACAYASRGGRHIPMASVHDEYDDHDEEITIDDGGSARSWGYGA